VARVRSERFNKEDFPYGAWLEERRRALVSARIANPFFWYSFGATTALALLTILSVKLWIDSRRYLWIAAEFLADIYNHDRYSRHVAREAIDRYNQHIEACNRAIEAAEEGRPTPGTVVANDLRAEVDRLNAELGAKESELSKVKTELDARKAIVSDLSARLDALAQQLDAGKAGSRNANADLVDRINRLERELHEEPQKNRRVRTA
jgi:hypothetical protein